MGFVEDYGIIALDSHFLLGRGMRLNPKEGLATLVFK
jgi:hypothetical protein